MPAHLGRAAVAAQHDLGLVAAIDRANFYGDACSLP
jgi:hypothetical protein